MMRQYKPGDEVVAGVKILAPIGAGGFGMVYKVSVSGGVEKALKIINLQGTQGIKEFNALRLIKRISHPNLVEIDSYWLRDMQGKLINFDSDDSINAEKQALELIILMSLGRMSLLDMLNQYRKQGKPGIPYPELIELMTDTAKAIDFLNSPHDLGLKEPVCVQHGDIKPGNILLKGNSVQVCDYGLAKAITKGPRTSVALFSPAYCSPEANNNKPSNWSDQFSLAISYYELRTGKLPFNEEDAMNAGIEAVLGKLDFTLLPRLEQEVLHKATDPVPHQRFPKCIDFVNALRASQSNQRDSGSKPRTLEEILQADSEIVSGYKLLHRLNFSEREEFWKAVSPASKQFVIHVIREFKGSLGNQLVQALETLRQMDEHENLINLRNCWTLHTDGRAVPYVDPSSLGNDTIALVTQLDNVECTLEDYYNECLKKKHPGIPEHELMQFMSQTARGIDYLTQMGYAEFLDLKPQTILLTKNKSVKIGITGLAKRMLAGSTTMTTDRLINAFAPPELFDFAVGKHWNSNQYSLALTYYWLRSRGKLPFPPNSTPKQIREHHLQGQLDFSAVSEREQTILYNATVQDPNHRFESCDAFVEALSIAVGYSIPAGVSGRHPGSDHGIDRQTPQPGAHITPQHEPYEEEQQALAQRPTPSTLPNRTTPQNMPQGGPVEGTLDFGEIDFERLYGHGITGPRSGGPKALQPVVKPATPQETPPYVRPDDKRVSDGKRSFREEAELRRKKRKRLAVITSLVGLLVIAVTVALVVPKLVWPSPTPTGTGSGPDPLKLQLEQASKEVQDALDKKDFDLAIRLVKKEKDEAWIASQKKLIGSQLEPWLSEKMKEVKELPQALKQLGEYKSKYQDMVTVAWFNDWDETLKKREKELIPGRWTKSWDALLEKLAGLNATNLNSIRTELQSVLQDAPSESDKQQAQKLLASFNELDRIHQQVQASDAAILNKALEDYLAWEKSAQPKLVNSSYSHDIASQAINHVRKLVEKAADAKTMLSYESVLEKLLKVDPKSPDEMFYAGLLEIALQNNKYDAPATREYVDKLVRSNPYSKFVKAQWLLRNKPADALTMLEEIQPRLNGTEALKLSWRQNTIALQLEKLIEDARDQQPYSFKKEKQAEAARILALLQKWPSVPEEKKRLHRVSELLLAAEIDPEKGKTSLDEFSKSNDFKMLDKGMQDVIIARLPVDMSIASQLTRARTKLDDFFAQKEVTYQDIIDQVIVPLTDSKRKEEFDSLTSEQKNLLANILSDLGEEIAFNKDLWLKALSARKLEMTVAAQLLESAINFEQDVKEQKHIVRHVIAQYEKSSDTLINKWKKQADTAKQTRPEYFGSHLLGGISSYMHAIYTGTEKTADAIKELKLADADFSKAEELLNQNPSTRHANKYLFRIVIDRCNIALQLANLHVKREDCKTHLDAAILLADQARKIFKDDPELIYNYGLIYEDQILLLNGAPSGYDKAIGEFNKIQNTRLLHGKPILSRGRCYYRKGAASRNEADIRLALQDLDRFVRIKEASATNKIDAHYYKALCYFDKAMDIKAGSPEWKTEYNNGLDELDNASTLIKNNQILLSKSHVDFAIFEKAYYAADIIIQNKSKDYVNDDFYKNMIDRIQGLKSSLTEVEPLYQYINARLAEVEVKEPAEALKQSISSYEEVIKILKTEPSRDPTLYLSAIQLKSLNSLYLWVSEKRSNPSVGVDRLKKAYNECSVAYELSKHYELRMKQLGAQCLETVILLSQYLFNADKNDQNWKRCLNHVSEIISNHPAFFVHAMNLDRSRIKRSVTDLVNYQADKKASALSQLKESASSIENSELKREIIKLLDAFDK